MGEEIIKDLLNEMIDIIDFDYHIPKDWKPIFKPVKNIRFNDNKNIEYPINNRQYLIDNDLKRKIWYNREDMMRFANESIIIMRLLKSGYNIDEDILSNTLFPKPTEIIDETVYPDEDV
jgi:hypothetical protein|uniref:Uncharacterized protein n=1 Tax=viral metagenome TaxID=1070528 RepID=A0A6C0LQ97_9ZZZZ